MWINTSTASMTLNPLRATRLKRACGATLLGVKGIAWITIDRDRRDIVLEPGQQFVIDSDQPVMLLPLRSDATVQVIAATGPSPCARTRRTDRRGRAWQIWRKWMARTGFRLATGGPATVGA